MATPAPSDAAKPPAGPHWWIKPAVISVLNLSAVLIVVTFVIGWSAPMLVILLAGCACGTWWFLQQRPQGT